MSEFDDDADEYGDDSLVKDLHRQLREQRKETARLRDELAEVRGPQRPTSPEAIAAAAQAVRSASNQAELDEALKAAGFAR
jgi:hypothetical protein